jgi:hypothetical protein
MVKKAEINIEDPSPSFLARTGNSSDGDREKKVGTQLAFNG